jgi:tRNA threonylcarbamoyladenosine biosynthesis protein TsaE
MGTSRVSKELHLISKHVADTVAIGAAVASVAQGGDVLGLQGELGAGKTQFVRGLARGLGLDPAQVSSPTFVLMHEYESSEADGVALVHIDAYRVGSFGDLESLGWAADPDLRRNTVVAVEWADRLGQTLGDDLLLVRIEHMDDEVRRLTLSSHGVWHARWHALSVALDTYIEPTPRTPCPICQRQVAASEATFPFCSARCRTIDLGRWIDGRYLISRPVEHSDLEEGVD